VGSTAWDTFLHALDPEVAPRGLLPVVRNIQPTAPIAWGTEFTSPPLADRAYAFGHGNTAALPAPLVGQTGGAILAKIDPAFGVTVEEESVGAWFWVEVVAPFISDLFYHVSLIVPGALNLVGAPLAPFAVQMSPTTSVLSCAGVVTTNIGPPASWIFKGGNTGDKHIIGPLFKPPGKLVHVTGALQQNQCLANFRWVEIPDPR